MKFDVVDIDKGKCFCFECRQWIDLDDWIKNPIDNYGCSRHL